MHGLLWTYLEGLSIKKIEIFVRETGKTAIFSVNPIYFCLWQAFCGKTALRLNPKLIIFHVEQKCLKYFSTIGFDCLHLLCLYLLFLSSLNLNLKRFKLNLSISSRSKQCRICWSWKGPDQTGWVGECWGCENLSKTIPLQSAIFTCLRWMSLQVICFCKSRSLANIRQWNSNEHLLNPPTCSWFASGAVCTSCPAWRSP